MHTLVQYGAMEDEMKAFHTYEELLLEWMQNMVFMTFLYFPFEDYIYIYIYICM